MTHHIPFTAWATVLIITGIVIVLSFLWGPLRRYLRRLISSIGLGMLAAIGITSWVYKKHPAAFKPAAGHAGHAVSTTTTLVSAFIGITLAVALLAFVVITVVSGRRRTEPEYRAPSGRRRRSPVGSTRRSW